MYVKLLLLIVLNVQVIIDLQLIVQIVLVMKGGLKLQLISHNVINVYQNVKVVLLLKKIAQLVREYKERMITQSVHAIMGILMIVL